MQEAVVFGLTPWLHAYLTGTEPKAPRLSQCLGAVACSYLDAVYRLHMAAIKPQASAAVAVGSDDRGSPRGHRIGHGAKIGNVHDFVSEMVIGTWIAFKAATRSSPPPFLARSEGKGTDFAAN